MIVSVYTMDEKIQFDHATRYCTDEHNNLEVMSGKNGDKPLGLFNKEHWNRVLVGEEVDDEEAE